MTKRLTTDSVRAPNNRLIRSFCFFCFLYLICLFFFLSAIAATAYHTRTLATVASMTFLHSWRSFHSSDYVFYDNCCFLCNRNHTSRNSSAAIRWRQMICSTCMSAPVLAPAWRGLYSGGNLLLTLPTAYTELWPHFWASKLGGGKVFIRLLSERFLPTSA